MTFTPRCLRERVHHLVAFVQAQQAVVDEHAGELVADRAVEQRRGDATNRRRRKGRAAPRRRRPARASRSTRLDDVVRHVPVAARSRRSRARSAQDRRALLRVRDLGMELHAVEAPRLVGHRGDRAGRRSTPISLKPGGSSVDLVAVAHPDVEHAVALGASRSPRCRRAARCGRARAPRRSRTRARCPASTSPPSCCAMVCMP